MPHKNVTFAGRRPTDASSMHKAVTFRTARESAWVADRGLAGPLRREEGGCIRTGINPCWQAFNELKSQQALEARKTFANQALVSSKVTPLCCGRPQGDVLVLKVTFLCDPR